MATLQRSAVSFRRQGSSGLVWYDDHLIKQMNQREGHADHRELRPCQSTGNIGMMARSGSVAAPPICIRSSSSPAIDAPSPQQFGCRFLSVFGRTSTSKKLKKSKKPVQ